MFMSSVHTLNSTVSLKSVGEEGSSDHKYICLAWWAMQLCPSAKRKIILLLHRHILETAEEQIKTGFSPLLQKMWRHFCLSQILLIFLMDVCIWGKVKCKSSFTIKFRQFMVVLTSMCAIKCFIIIHYKVCRVLAFFFKGIKEKVCRNKTETWGKELAFYGA